MKSILMIGQSNMAGRGFINEVPMICNERILMLRNAGWQMMAEPINYDRPNAGIGLAGSFAAMFIYRSRPEAERQKALEEALAKDYTMENKEEILDLYFHIYLQNQNQIGRAHV